MLAGLSACVAHGHAVTEDEAIDQVGRVGADLKYWSTYRGRIGSVPTMKHTAAIRVTTFRRFLRWRFTVDARTGNASYVEDGAYWYTIETWDKLADNVVLLWRATR